ncbi:DUF3311 domain-containing protein [Amycolatopsis taiwanensis]|uniref:Uncharacterized protein n=1 Tax=Amycolatopsis taiwanensis TaxID=342230 RepID=A0A9W6VJ13_9PSEU|nr:DUF3311 domain-containing protein [Amycolatopsis taiwanensis]GLY70250.1 hypothetical protein Atai01_68690 [Amycolatopsis taiwanensis]
MKRSLLLGFTPYVVLVIGIPFANSTHVVLGMPLLLLWITVCVVATPLFLWLASRTLPDDDERK